MTEDRCCDIRDSSHDSEDRSKVVKENKVAVKSEDFAVRIIRLVRYLNGNGEYVMAKQILRSGTSIGANVAESQNAQSANDFISKLSISLKEAGETAYWLRLLKRTEYNRKVNTPHSSPI